MRLDRPPASTMPAMSSTLSMLVPAQCPDRPGRAQTIGGIQPFGRLPVLT